MDNHSWTTTIQPLDQYSVRPRCVPLSERLTCAERERLGRDTFGVGGTFLDLGRFDLAAAKCCCDPETVSRTWHAWRRQIAAELFGDGAGQ